MGSRPNLFWGVDYFGVRFSLRLRLGLRLGLGLLLGVGLGLVFWGSFRVRVRAWVRVRFWLGPST